MKIILDAGHGGIHPMTLQYVTSGKRMVKDDVVFYEGVNNRDNVNRIAEELEDLGYEVIKLVDTWRDISLTQRVEEINAIEGKKIVISIHSDANSNGREWNQAHGMGCFIYTNCSEDTSKLSYSLNNSLICNFDGIVKNRGIRKANFYILKYTNCPAVLLELGFHTNREEVKLMQTEPFKDKVVNSIVEAIQEYEKK